MMNGDDLKQTPLTAFEEDCFPMGEEAPLVDPDEFPRWILFQSDDLLVIDKPGWLVCHPSKNGPLSSLVGAAKLLTGLPSIHLVSRLDRETSGLVILAKNRPTASVWQTAIEQRRAKKIYLAILHGTLEQRTEVSRALELDPDSPVRVKQRISRTGGGQKAQSTFIPLGAGGGYTLCRVLLHTGRKHQIRAHAQWLGHPVAGDKLYGSDEGLYLEFSQKGWTSRLAAALPLPRQALHAHRITIDLPTETRQFCAPLAPELARFARMQMNLPESLWSLP